MELKTGIFLFVALSSLGLATMYGIFIFKLGKRGAVSWGYVSNMFTYLGITIVFVGIGLSHNTTIVMGLWITTPTILFNLINTIRLRKIKVRAVLELDESNDGFIKLQTRYTDYIKDRTFNLERKMKDLLKISPNGSKATETNLKQKRRATSEVGE